MNMKSIQLNEKEIQDKGSGCEVIPSFFNLLNSEQLKSINSNRFQVSFKAGETIIKQGSPLTHVIYLSEGKAKVLLESFGQTVLLKILSKPAIICGPGLYTDYRHYFSVEALGDTKTCFVDINLFKQLTLSNQSYVMKLVTDLNREIINLYDKLKSLTQKHMNGRLADTLIYLSEDIYQSREFTTELSRSDIANMSCMTNGSAIRTLKDFKDDGIIDCNGNHFKILKKEVLLDLSKKG